MPVSDAKQEMVKRVIEHCAKGNPADVSFGVHRAEIKAAIVNGELLEAIEISSSAKLFIAIEDICGIRLLGEMPRRL